MNAPKRPELSPGPAPGQRPLLDRPTCDCPAREVHPFTMRIVDLAMSALETGRLCPIAVGTSLALTAGSILNPANVTPETRAAAKKGALVVAEALETIARGMRQRAGDA